MHNQLPADILNGHRDRFNKLHSQLRQLYSKVSNITYIRERITLPEIPVDAPDFLKTVEFKQHKSLAKETNEVERKNSEEQDSASLITVDDLLGLGASATQSDAGSVYNFPPMSMPATSQPVASPNNELIPNLLEQIETLKMKISQMEQDQTAEINTLFQALSNAKSVLATKDLEIDELKSKVDENLQKNQVEQSTASKQALGAQQLYNTIKQKYMKLCQDHAKVLSKNQEQIKSIQNLQLKLTENQNGSIDKTSILTAISVKASQIILNAEKDKVILEEEKAKKLLNERSQRCLKIAITNLNNVFFDNLPELCGGLISLAYQVNSILIVGLDVTESSPICQDLIDAANHFFQRFSEVGEGKIEISEWIEADNLKGFLRRDFWIELGSGGAFWVFQSLARLSNSVTFQFKNPFPRSNYC